MLVVISDLHFEEEASDTIPGTGAQQPVAFSRNLPGKVFRNFIAHLAEEATRNRARRLDLAFAGDIFDLHRTSLWFLYNPAGVRPYADSIESDDELEALVLRIIDRISKEKEVRKSLESFRRLASGLYWDKGEKEFPIPVNLHYIPGNHDRLANATPALRRAVREALGLPISPEPLGHVLTFPKEGALIRHGHEYDRYNFGRDYRSEKTIPLNLPDDEYNASPFGDFATVDIASRLPQMFRQHHGDDRILTDPLLRTVYLRFLEFDDLRPQSAILNFLLHIPSEHIDPVNVWETVEPVIHDLLEQLYDDPFLKMWLDKMDKKWQLDAIDVIQTALALKSWRLAGIPLGLAQFISNTAVGGQREQPGAETMAAREQVIMSGEYRFLVAGHTHRPAVELIASDEKSERYYIDTGTWRNRIPANADFTAFGRLKTLTYVVIYGPDEDVGIESHSGKLASVDFWSGVTQRW